MSKREIATQLLIARKRAFRDQGGRCFWCDRPMTKEKPKKRPWPQLGRGKPADNYATADHLILSSDGGRDDESNIVAACNRCNNKRGNLRVSEWIAILARHVSATHLAVILQRLARFGIQLAIGQPAPAAPTVDNPIVRAPEVEAPAPQGQPGNRSEGQPKDHPPSTV